MAAAEANNSPPRTMCLDRALRLYLQQVPINLLVSELKSAAVAGGLSWGCLAFQEMVVADVIASPVADQFPPRTGYVSRLTKLLLEESELCGEEPPEVLLRARMACVSSAVGGIAALEDETAFESFWLPPTPSAYMARTDVDGSQVTGIGVRDDKGAFLSFRVANRDNEVGLRVWEAGRVLAEFCLARADLLNGKRVLELGAGIGMTGLMIAGCCGASEVVLTDYAPRVLANLRFNVETNRSVVQGRITGATANVTVRSLDWTDYSKIAARRPLACEKITVVSGRSRDAASNNNANYLSNTGRTAPAPGEEMRDQSTGGGTTGRSEGGIIKFQSTDCRTLGQSTSSGTTVQSTSGGITDQSTGGGMTDQCSGDGTTCQTTSGGTPGQSKSGGTTGQSAVCDSATNNIGGRGDDDDGGRQSGDIHDEPAGGNRNNAVLNSRYMAAGENEIVRSGAGVGEDSLGVPEVVLAADVVYDVRFHGALVGVVLETLRRYPDALIIFASTLRNAHTMTEFHKCLERAGVPWRRIAFPGATHTPAKESHEDGDIKNTRGDVEVERRGSFPAEPTIPPLALDNTGVTAGISPTLKYDLKGKVEDCMDYSRDGDVSARPLGLGLWCHPGDVEKVQLCVCGRSTVTRQQGQGQDVL